MGDVERGRAEREQMMADLRAGAAAEHATCSPYDLDHLAGRLWDMGYRPPELEAS